MHRKMPAWFTRRGATRNRTGHSPEPHRVALPGGPRPGRSSPKPTLTPKPVCEKALAVLNGQASTVAAAIHRKATCLNLEPPQRRNADISADYLLAKKDYLDYPQALAAGWPIATGIIEVACRHLVKDRLDLTGAPWGLHGAEAILKLRALRSNDDWASYWTLHLNQERHRIHETRYADHALPTAA